MNHVPRKYRGTRLFHRVRRDLQRAATEGRFVPYGDVASLMGLPRQGNHMACETGHISGEISEHTHAQGLPMLSAIVVRRDTGMPGQGFFTLAEQLGRLPRGASAGAKRRFWRQEVRAIFATW
jgi:alkylated DNA nucleotide flippase Atl1